MGKLYLLFILVHVQRGDAADNVPLPGGEPGHRQARDALRAADRRHHQHGRHGALRGRRHHLHRTDERRTALTRRGHHRQVSECVDLYSA